MHVLLKSSGACVALGLACALPAFGQQPFRLQEAIGAPEWLSVSGSVRLRYETLANQFVAGRTGNDEMLATQSLLKVEAHHDAFAAGIELADARRWTGDAGGGAAGETDALEPLQLYVAWRPRHVFTEAGQLDLTLGRFTLDLGSRRLVSRSNMRFPLQAFTGARAVWKETSGLQATAFYASPVIREPSDARSALDNEIVLDRETGTRFGGLLLEAPTARDLHADVFVYNLNEDDAPDILTRNRQLTTYGVRLRRAQKSAALDFELEATLQAGSARATTAAADVTSLSVNAHMIHAEVGYTFDASWSPRLALLYDLASGDRDPTDRKSQRFDPLFGDRRFDLGPTGIFGAIARTNFSSPSLRLEVKPDAVSDAFIAWRVVKLDCTRDSFANSGVRDATGASGDHPGDQLEARYRRWLVKEALRLELGGAWVREARFLKDAPNATRLGDPAYGYVELQWTF
jgi:hypothetical protein